MKFPRVWVGLYAAWAGWAYTTVAATMATVTIAALVARRRDRDVPTDRIHPNCLLIASSSLVSIGTRLNTTTATMPSTRHRAGHLA